MNPHDSSTIYLFHSRAHTLTPGSSAGLAVTQLYLSVVKEVQKDSLIVISKNDTIINDTLFWGSLSACRHGNGRDWWVFVPEVNNNCFYKLLVTPDTIMVMPKQCIGMIRTVEFGGNLTLAQMGDTTLEPRL